MKNLVIERGRVVAFSDLPPNSVALDGYVQGPELDLKNRCFSFDHHSNCLRMVTRATCQQVMDALLLGLDTTDLTVYVNDVDADTVLSVWLLKHPDILSDTEAGMSLRDLVESVGLLDSHGPAYPLVDPAPATAFHSLVMGPEKEARRDKTYQTCCLYRLMEKCLLNLDLYFWEVLHAEVVEESKVPYTITHTGDTGWVMATAEGYLFSSLYQDGYTKAIAYMQLPDGSYQYTVGKKSDLVSGFPVGPASEEGSILHTLNQRDPGWGGGSSIGGSPRNKDGSSSKLTPDEVFEIVQGLLKDYVGL